VVAAGGQAILLAPEIALATQTWQRLIDRLPRVAVLHSGLTDAQRAFYWQQIRDGHASVIVGPRSAVFAPARKLGLVIVDEEHESSYKQDTVPRYHGRDVAVKRASLAGVPIILGSATPSMESLHNARQGRYELVQLPNRVRGLAMPRLHIVHLREDMERGRVELIGRTLTARMAAALDRGEQVILLMNRRGYASYVFCPKCDWMLECDQCIRPLVWHQATQLCICHHCNATASLPDRCPACGGKLLLFGYGIQRVENELARKFPTGRVARMDSDTMTSPKQFQKVLGEFGSGEIDILLGTQMVAKGLDFPKVSLVGIASADTSLSIHDFRASERTFQLIVQVAGRAGRSDTPGEVVVQTLHPGEPAIEMARNHDYKAFAEMELQDRQAAGFPPFSRMVRFILTHARQGEAEASADRLGEILRQCIPASEATIIGPQPAMLPRLRDEFRFDILLLTQQAGLVQQRLGGRMKAISSDIKADLAVDVDPMNLL
jgi:primosomal protein N' (replication factor Y)